MRVERDCRPSWSHTDVRERWEPIGVLLNDIEELGVVLAQELNAHVFHVAVPLAVVYSGADHKHFQAGVRDAKDWRHVPVGDAEAEKEGEVVVEFGDEWGVGAPERELEERQLLMRLAGVGRPCANSAFRSSTARDKADRPGRW